MTGSRSRGDHVMSCCRGEQARPALWGARNSERPRIDAATRYARPETRGDRHDTARHQTSSAPIPPAGRSGAWRSGERPDPGPPGRRHSPSPSHSRAFLAARLSWRAAASPGRSPISASQPPALSPGTDDERPDRSAKAPAQARSPRRRWLAPDPGRDGRDVQHGLDDPRQPITGTDRVRCVVRPVRHGTREQRCPGWRLRGLLASARERHGTGQHDHRAR